MNIMERERDLVRIGATALGVVASLLAVLVGVLQRGGVFGPRMDALQAPIANAMSDITFVMAAVAFAGSLLLLARPRIGRIVCVAALVGGVFGAETLWEFPGALLLVAILISVMAKSETVA